MRNTFAILLLLCCSVSLLCASHLSAEQLITPSHHSHHKSIQHLSNMEAIHLHRGISIDRSHTEHMSTIPPHEKLFMNLEKQELSHPYLVKLKSEVVMKQVELEQEFLAKANVKLLDYFPHKTFLIVCLLFFVYFFTCLPSSLQFASQEQLLQIEEQLDYLVDFVHEFKPHYKIAIDATSEELTTSSKLHSKPLLTKLFYSDVSDCKLAVEEIKQQLQKQLLMSFIQDIHCSSSHTIMVHFHQATISKEIKSQVIEVISHHRLVQYIQHHGTFFAENDVERWVMQSNKQDVTPYFDIGLTGKGQIISYGDSGLDYKNCMFYDDQVPNLTFTTTDSDIKTNPTHRKVLQYYSYMDNMDETPGGHGSHVGGTLSGKALFADSAMTRYNSMAMDVKVSFMDLQCNSKVGPCSCQNKTGCPCPNGICANGPELYLPTDLDEGYFPVHYKVGARIHSNSIGGEIANGYQANSVEIDKFMYEHDDFLVCWSAGNSGSLGYATLTGPFKMAKNNLVVGAGMKAFAGFPNVVDNFNDYQWNTVAYRSKLTTFATCNTTFIQEQCSAISQITNVTLCCDQFNSCQDDTGYKKFKAAYTTIHSAFRTCCDVCLRKYIGDQQALLDFNSVAAFTSMGPTLDGRTKPDIIAPGTFVLSSRSDSSSVCNKDTTVATSILPMSGTSMATPTASATAMVARSYFVEGFYPTGQANPDHKMTSPSGSLIKAALIHSARPMTGSVRFTNTVDLDLSKLPKSQKRLIEGHGLINLSNTLKLQQVNSFSMFVVDRKSIQTNRQHSWTFNIKENQKNDPVVITLAWTDYPGNPTSALALVNDLDLVVYYTAPNSPNTIGYFGNAIASDPSSNYPDHLNNVEKIIIEKVEPNTVIKVMVRGFNVPKPQNYSLIVTGADFVADTVASTFADEEYQISINYIEPGPDRRIVGLVILSIIFFIGAVGFAIIGIAFFAYTIYKRVSKKKYEEVSSEESRRLYM